MDVLTIISNGAFILPAVESARRRRWTRFCIYLLVLVNSSIYHTCNSFAGQCAGLPPHVTREMDFFFAQLMIPLTALYVIDFPEELYWMERVLIILSAFIIFLVEQYFESTLLLQLILTGISLTFILIYWAWYALNSHHTKRQHSILPPYRWPHFAMAIGLTAVASSLFVVEMIMPPFYWAVHSIWHVDAALAQYFLLLIWPPKDGDEKTSRKYVALDKPLQKRRRKNRFRFH